MNHRPAIKGRKYTAFMMMLFASIFTLSTSAHAENIQVTSKISHPYIIAGADDTVYIKVELEGSPIDKHQIREPVNLALVIDKSGSMSGQKMQDLKEAAKMMVDRLSPSDMISIITYDNQARVVVPASRPSEPAAIKAHINTISTGGGTALYAGVQTGAQELYKYLDDFKINRVILLSDGLANVGPSKPHELGNLGKSLIKRGVSVSTIGLGLGYNEDLMAQLATYSDGFHQFAQDSSELGDVLDWQFGKLSSVVATDAQVNLKFANGITPVRILGRKGTISGDNVKVRLSQIFSTHVNYVLVEARITKTAPDTRELNIAKVAVNYFDLGTNSPQRYGTVMKAAITNDATLARNTRDQDVIIAATEQKSADIHAEAIQLRDSGQVTQAKEKLETLSQDVNQAAEDLGSDRLDRYGKILKEQLENIMNDKNWNQTRKQGTATLQSVSFGTI